ncbi:MAG TPA: putative peptidoglycan glycosyltransferase FtsW [Gemmatimonadaceae bacterium]|nr:putative peptidoglycan glycosyltransferase FtsW [Gemmatimonadaceae bacterium]
MARARRDTKRERGGRRAAPSSTRSIRERWRMGVHARAMVIVTAVLLAFGLAVLYSASAVLALREGHDSMYYLLRQVSGVALGVFVFAFAAKCDAERWRTWAWPLMAASLVLLLITILPFTTAIAPRVNGSRRWVRLGFLFQSSELGKLAVVTWTAMLIVKKGDMLRRLTKGLLPFLLVVGVLDVLVILEPDLSTAMMYTLIMALVLFAGGVRIGHVVVLGILAVPLLWHEVERVQYALLRMTAFLDPGSAPMQASYQLRQSLIAVGSGGLFGVGFGQGRQQNGFLPFPYNDFIASNIGEEWGFLGLLALTLFFAVYAYLGFRIAKHARTPFQRLVAIGLTVTVVITAYLHIGVVIGLLPTTGLTLPFISYGRSNLVLSLLMTGILVNIGSKREKVVGADATNPLLAARG